MKDAFVLAAAAGLLVAAAPLQKTAEPIVVYAAGSTTGALGAMLKRYTSLTGQEVTLVTGPAGLLRERIEKGEHADLFVSANIAHPQRLFTEGKAEKPATFARNTLCVTARPDVGLTSANLLDKLLDPEIGIGTSTPGADPGGDYAWALFDKAETVRPGAAAILKAKAQQLVGGRSDPPVPAGKNAAQYFMDTHRVDLFIGYCSSRDTRPDLSVTKVVVPPALAVPVTYDMAVIVRGQDGQQRAAERLERWLQTKPAQAMLAPYGFRKAD